MGRQDSTNDTTTIEISASQNVTDEEYSDGEMETVTLMDNYQQESLSPTHNCNKLR